MMQQAISVWQRRYFRIIRKMGTAKEKGAGCSATQHPDLLRSRQN